MSKRTERLDSELQKEISSIVSGPLKNKFPELGGLISVTEVDVAPDLKTAKVYISIYAASPRTASQSSLSANASSSFAVI